MKTYLPKVSEIKTNCYLIDAKDQVLGRVAAKAATILRGKHKRTYTPFLDCGDNVVIINADKVRVTGNKLNDKRLDYYTGYPSGYRDATVGDMLKRRPAKVMELAVERMFPSGPLAYKQRGKLRVYTGDAHPHSAQKPIVVEI